MPFFITEGIVKFLLDTEADPRVRNRKRQTPLNLAQNSVIKRELQMAFDVLPPIIITRKEVRIFQHLKDLDTLINGNISHHSIDLDTVSHCAVSLSNMLYTLLSTGSTQEDRKSS